MSDNNKQQGTSLGKRLALIGVAVAIIVIAHFLPTPEGLSYAGKMAIALMVSGIVLWVTEPVPMAISGLALMDSASSRTTARPAYGRTSSAT